MNFDTAFMIGGAVFWLAGSVTLRWARNEVKVAKELNFRSWKHIMRAGELHTNAEEIVCEIRRLLAQHHDPLKQEEPTP
jgi:hypothetical protein